MPSASAKVLADALELPAEDRLDVAAELLASVDSEADPGWEAAWVAECDRRMAEVENGSVQPVSWPEARERIRSRLAGR
jgi:putative addiction module component (TIGR02574 family)